MSTSLDQSHLNSLKVSNFSIIYVAGYICLKNTDVGFTNSKITCIHIVLCNIIWSLPVKYFLNYVFHHDREVFLKKKNY